MDNQCSTLRVNDIKSAQTSLYLLVHVPLSTNEETAYTDFILNEGAGAF
jgi:hypothetical protein